MEEESYLLMEPLTEEGEPSDFPQDLTSYAFERMPYQGEDLIVIGRYGLPFSPAECRFLSSNTSEFDEITRDLSKFIEDGSFGQLVRMMYQAGVPNSAAKQSQPVIIYKAGSVCTANEDVLQLVLRMDERGGVFASIDYGWFIPPCASTTSTGRVNIGVTVPGSVDLYLLAEDGRPRSASMNGALAARLDPDAHCFIDTETGKMFDRM